MSFKLQHWLVTISYLPGELNTLADALSREERQPEKGQQDEDRHQQKTPVGQDTRVQEMEEEDASRTGRRLAAGGVEGTPPR